MGLLGRKGFSLALKLSFSLKRDTNVLNVDKISLRFITKSMKPVNVFYFELNRYKIYGI